MSAHVVVADATPPQDVLAAVHELASREFEIEHVTVQIESAGWETKETHL